MTWDDDDEVPDRDDLGAPPFPVDDDEDLSDVGSAGLGMHEVDLEDWPEEVDPSVDDLSVAAAHERELTAAESPAWSASLAELDRLRRQRAWLDLQQLCSDLLSAEIGIRPGKWFFVS